MLDLLDTQSDMVSVYNESLLNVKWSHLPWRQMGIWRHYTETLQETGI